jgi:glutamate synthase (ferredoxin)
MDRVNGEIVQCQRVVTAAGEAHLKGLLEEHVERTGSIKATELLADWSNSLAKFWQLVPPSEASTPEASLENCEQGASSLAEVEGDKVEAVAA